MCTPRQLKLLQLPLMRFPGRNRHWRLIYRATRHDLATAVTIDRELELER